MIQNTLPVSNPASKGTSLHSIPIRKPMEWLRLVVCFCLVPGITSVSAQTSRSTGPDPSLVLHRSVQVELEKVFWGDTGRRTVWRGNVDGTQSEMIVSSRPDLLNRNSIVIDHDAGKVYFGSGLEVIRCELDGSNLETLFSFGGEPRMVGLAIDPVDRMLYIARAGEDTPVASSIERTSLDGIMQPVMIVKPADHVRDLAVDPIARKLYWIDDFPRMIRSANLDGSNVVDVLSLLTRPLSLAVHPTNGDLYWANWFSGSSKTDGSVQRSFAPQFSTIETVVTGLDHLGDITFDVAAQKIYFVESSRILRRSALNGTGLETLFRIEDSGAFSGLALTTVALESCLPGSFGVTGAEPCLSCLAGTFQPDAGATECSPCPAGTAQPSQGSTQCTSCQAGTFQPSSGQSECDLCACDDSNGCTTNDCDAVSGECQNEPIAGCTIPTVSQWGVIMLSLLMGTAGTLILRRRLSHFD